MGIFDKSKILGEKFEGYLKVVSEYYDTGEKLSEGIIKEMHQGPFDSKPKKICTGTWTWYFCFFSF